MVINLYRRLYRIYNNIMQLSGFNYQIKRFIYNNIKNKNVQSILDAGCGTGITGLSLLELYPNSNLLLTDINRELLLKLQDKTSNKNNVLLGLSDISYPNKIKTLKGEELTICDEEFDIICAGANIGYSKNPEQTISTLYQILKPGGSIIDLEMGRNFWGLTISKLYCYPVVSWGKIDNVVGRQGAIITIQKISWFYFPLNLTRVYITITKPVN